MILTMLLHAALSIAKVGDVCPPGRGGECLEVAVAAMRHGVSPRLAVVLAVSESSMRRGVESPAGAVGLLQVIPGYWCPEPPAACDLTDAGARALGMLTRRHGVERGLCHYASGNTCNARALRYARLILTRAR